MIVFKNYLKIARTYALTILIYTFIFLGLNIIVGMYNSSATDYQSTEVNIAIINHDGKSDLVTGLTDYISKNGNLITIKDDQEAMRDALFFRQVDYIMIIPENFNQDFISGKDVSIETMELPDAYNSIYSKNLLNKYLNTARLYINSNVSEFSTMIEQDLNNTVKVSLNGQQNDIDFSKVTDYYNFANYMLVTITMVVITMIMVSFNEEKIKRRNLVAPISYQSMNRQLLLGNYTVGFLIWGLYVLFSFILYPQAMFSYNGLLLVINSIALMIFIQVFSFLLTKFTSNREILSGIGNVIGLGSSFLCGAFVPQSMLSPFVISIAKFLPPYWFIKNNNEIAKIAQFNLDSLNPILINIIIILAFALVVYIITQLVAKWQLKR
ncbi:ABC transporter permease [uncultured Thomasclavelia sp.]|uniref:ABC transporter permease n=1 Tax=uncultured Thomasclavelia sp. TaxID=3025759 RepID=UPI0025D1E95F|nr:ABC transporter permease [uncultured Thomasclavelia sp.]